MQFHTPSKEQLRRWLCLSFMIVTVTLCTYTCSPRRGLLSTLPLLLVGSLLSAVVCYLPKQTALLAAFCGFTFCVADAMGMGLGLVVAGFCALTAWLACLSAKHFTKFFRQKKPLSLLLALLFLLPSPLLQGVLYATPWENQRMETAAQSYLQQKYPDQTFTEIRSYFDLTCGKHRALVRFETAAHTLLEATLTLEGDTVKEDGFFSLFCEKGLEEKQRQFVNLIRSQYPQELLFMDCSQDGLTPDVKERLEGSYGSVPAWLDTSATLDLGFRFSLPDAPSFVEKAKEYFTLLRESDVSFDRLRFFGGDQGVYLYTVTVTPDTSPDELASLLKHCKISMNIPSVSLEYSYLY